MREPTNWRWNAETWGRRERKAARQGRYAKAQWSRVYQMRRAARFEGVA